MPEDLPNARKARIREIVLDILCGNETVKYTPDQFPHLKLGVAEVLVRRDGEQEPRDFLDVGDPNLKPDDTELLMEVFWDLVVDKIITIGADHCNPEFPWFRLHSSVRGKDRREVS